MPRAKSLDEAGCGTRVATFPLGLAPACGAVGSVAATFLHNGPTLDRDAVERETIAAGKALLARNPAVDTIVLECTNLPPYRNAPTAALGVPVFDVLDLLRDFRKRLG